jgi:hypothetical protein
MLISDDNISIWKEVVLVYSKMLSSYLNRGFEDICLKRHEASRDLKDLIKGNGYYRREAKWFETS